MATWARTAAASWVVATDGPVSWQEGALAGWVRLGRFRFVRSPLRVHTERVGARARNPDQGTDWRVKTNTVEFLWNVTLKKPFIGSAVRDAGS